MSKTDSIISLINSLSRTEKKYISTYLTNTEKSYFVLYKSIVKKPQITKEQLKKDFLSIYPQGAFDITIHYLYEKLLDLLLGLRRHKDPLYDLFQKIGSAKMLYERSMFNECFSLLKECTAEAKKNEFFDILIIIQKLELEYLLYLNFPNISEQELYHKQYQQNDAIKKLRKIIDQSSLYGLLKHRIIYKGNIRTAEQKKMMTDLTVSELYLSASSDADNFEISKNHQLFQASYLINEGSYTMALNAYKELNRLFEQNPHGLSSPPVYYLSVLEGTLTNLRAIGQYDEIPYYLEKLEHLKTDTAAEFQINVSCLIFQYKLIPWLDKGDFEKCMEIFTAQKENLYNRFSWLSPVRQCEFLLYASIIYIGCKKYKEAHRLINNAIFENNIEYLPIMRTIRIVRLIAYYELGDFDMIASETQSIRRSLSLKKERHYKVEHQMLWFLNKQRLPIQVSAREKLWNKLEQELNELYNDPLENQVLVFFDFIAWIEAKILKKNLSETLNKNFTLRNIMRSK